MPLPLSQKLYSMFEINLVKNQVPTRLDLPKRKKSIKPLLVATIAVIVLLSVASFAVYHFFKISIESRLHHIVIKDNKSKVALAKKKNEHKQKSERKTKKRMAAKNEQTSKKHTVHREQVALKKQSNKRQKLAKRATEKQKKHQIEVTAPKKKPGNSHQEKAAEGHQIKVEKLPKKPKVEAKSSLKKQFPVEIEPVFSLNIELEKIPKPIKKIKKKQINISFFAPDNVTKKLNPSQTAKKKKRKPLYKVVVRTLKASSLKRFLEEHKIPFTYRKKLFKHYTTYDIFVGGFDSYPYLVKFAMDLKKRGYTIYSVVNMNLLFYVCIDKNVSGKVKDRYLSVWSKTPFKVVVKPVEHKIYGYIFRFETGDKKVIELLKKRGYYPIIISSKNGA